MTQEEVIELARQADVWVAGQEPYQSQLEAFAKLVAEHERKEFAIHAVDIARRSVETEREACAKIADEWAVGWPHPSTVIAERIRGKK